MKKSELKRLIKEEMGSIIGYQVMGNPFGSRTDERYKMEVMEQDEDEFIDEEVGAQKIVLPKLIKLTGDNNVTRDFAELINDTLTEKQLNTFFKWLTKVEGK